MSEQKRMHFSLSFTKAEHYEWVALMHQRRTIAKRSSQNRALNVYCSLHRVSVLLSFETLIKVD